jgi:hypothetical protein
MAIVSGFINTRYPNEMQLGAHIVHFHLFQVATTAINQTQINFRFLLNPFSLLVIAIRNKFDCIRQDANLFKIQLGITKMLFAFTNEFE